MLKRWSFWAFAGLFFPSMLVLGIHAYIGSFNRFIADDYCSAYYAETLGVLRSVWFWYLTWFGRFAASLADNLLTLLGTRGIVMAVSVALLLWLAVVTLAIYSLLPAQSLRSDRLFAAVGLGAATVYVTLLVTPTVAQSLYWWGGMRSYIPPFLLAAANVTLFRQFVQKKRSGLGLFFWLGLSFLTPFLAGGFNETFTAVQVVFFVFILGLGLLTRQYQVKSQGFLFLAVGLAGAIAALLVVVLAPGNATRQAFFPKSPGLLTILNISLGGYLVFLQELVNTPDRIAGLLGLTAAAAWLGLQTRPNPAPAAWVAPAALVSGFIFAFGCFPSAAYALSDVPPDRTLIIPAYFLVISLALTGFFFGQWLSLRVGMAYGFSVNLGLFLGVTALMLFSTWVSGRDLYATRQDYIGYARQWDQMDAQITRAKAAGEQQVIIPIMTNWAGLDNPNDNPKFWLNYCYSKYYGINVLTPPDPNQ